MQFRPKRRPPAARVFVLVAAAVLAFPIGLPANADPEMTDRMPQNPPLTTPWTHEVGPGNALPEYPRPQLTRDRWRNLNGEWEYEAATSDQPATGRPLAEKILVPYPPESALSGIQRHDDTMLYRRTFEVPQDWRGQRVLLHFGAVDQQARVLVNGTEVANHGGGYTSFSADVTDALTPDGPQELVVEAQDRNDAAPYPLGKQRNQPGGIFYTGASGIWQTVWMEPVSPAHVEQLDITPDMADGRFVVNARSVGAEGHGVDVVVSEPNGGPQVGRATGRPNEDIAVPIPNPHLWSPDDPFLYDVTVRLLGPDGAPVDEVGSYAGMRSVSLVHDDQGRARIALNGKILFQHGPLDQGYWPDGIYTAPTDAALRFDLDKTKELGFNMVRKHVKVEPARWYYHADRLGLLVWQDMPSLVNGVTPAPEAKKNYEAELSAMIDQLGSHPSIVAWVPFNEGWGEFDTARIADEVRAQDPTRLVDANSGVNCCDSLPDSGAGHIYDDHTYVGPGTPEVTGDRASVDGEYGGLGLIVDGHLWPGQPDAYEMTDSPEQLTQRYGEINKVLADIVRDSGLSASIYTQTTDVENEVNGLYTYDRQVLKPDAQAVRQQNRAVIESGTP